MTTFFQLYTMRRCSPSVPFMRRLVSKESLAMYQYNISINLCYVHHLGKNSANFMKYSLEATFLLLYSTIDNNPDALAMLLDMQLSHAFVCCNRVSRLSVAQSTSFRFSNQSNHSQHREKDLQSSRLHSSQHHYCHDKHYFIKTHHPGPPTQTPQCRSRASTLNK